MTFFVLNVMLVSITGDPMIYTTRTAFDAAAPGLPIEDFETAFSDGPTVTFTGFKVTEMATSGDSFVSWKTDYVSSPTHALQFVYNGGNGTLTFEFDSDINAFAADIIDFGTTAAATDFFVQGRTSVDATVFTPTKVATHNPARGNIQFLGLTTVTPFRKLVFTSVFADTNDLINFDQVAFGTVAIPEPSGMMYLAIAGLFVSAAVWSRSRR